MALKLHGVPFSTCTSRVMSCLLEKGVEFELVPVNLKEGEHKKPAFIAKNPFGQIPVLEDGDMTFFESRAINAYLSHKYKDQGTDLIHYTNPKEAGTIGVWIEVESQQFNPPMSALVYQLVIMPMYGKPTDQAVVDAEAAKLGKVLDVYEARLTDNKFLAGDFFSLADLNHFPYTYYMMKTPYASLVNDRPHVKAWWESLLEKDTFKKIAANMSLAG